MTERLHTLPTFRSSEFSESSDTPKSYDCQFDIDSYTRLCRLESKIPPAEYVRRFLNWHRETLINLETNLGERFNAQLFEFRYPLEDNRMMHPFANQPFLDNIIEGQQHRLGSDSNLNHNQKRELAEVISFSTIESYFLDNPESQGKLINPSPPGGDYGSNFIDVFDLALTNDQTSVRIRRFAVSTSPRDHWALAQKLTNNQLPSDTPASEQDIKLKETVIRTSKTDKEILDLYLPDQSALSLEDYAKLKDIYKPWASDYIEAITSGATIDQAEKNLKDGLIFADIKMGHAADPTGTITDKSNFEPMDIAHFHSILAPQQLRFVKTGCGIQGHSATNNRDLISSTIYNLNSTSLFSGEDEYGTLQIHCEECDTTYQRTPGKLEKSCRRCGGTKGIVC